jgi:hypothetical protein
LSASTPDHRRAVEDDRAERKSRPKRRDPAKLLAFTGAHPGMKVLDMGERLPVSTS